MPTPDATRPVSPGKIVAGLSAAGLLLFLVGAGVVFATGSWYERPTVDLSAADAQSAYAACEGFARADLKAPGPVTFEPFQSWRVRRYADGRLRVRADADAVNAAGRQVDIRVACRLRPIEGGTWHLESLSISSD